jgi:hypothetical protein
MARMAISRSLMPLQTAGKQNHRRAIVLRADPRLKDLPVHVVDQNGAFAVDAGSLCILVKPEVVGDDHMVGVPG